MLHKIKVWIIRKLGGFVAADIKQTDYNSYQTGVYITLVSLRLFADNMNGVPAEEWCKRMYDHLTTSIRQQETSAAEEFAKHPDAL